MGPGATCVSVSYPKVSKSPCACSFPAVCSRRRGWASGRSTGRRGRLRGAEATLGDVVDFLDEVRVRSFEEHFARTVELRGDVKKITTTTVDESNEDEFENEYGEDEDSRDKGDDVHEDGDSRDSGVDHLNDAEKPGDVALAMTDLKVDGESEAKSKSTM